jgi:hypothetical protein
VPGPLLPEKEQATTETAAAPRNREKYRPTTLRVPLQDLLHTWRVEAHVNDRLASVRPASQILADEQISRLVKALPATVSSPEAITVFLNETVKWSTEFSSKVFSIIKSFDDAISTINLQKNYPTIHSPSDVSRLLSHADADSPSTLSKAVYDVVKILKEKAAGVAERASKRANTNLIVDRLNVTSSK